MTAQQPRELLRDMIAEVLIDRLRDLGVGTRDQENTDDGGLWLEAPEQAADDLAGCVMELFPEVVHGHASWTRRWPVGGVSNDH